MNSGRGFLGITDHCADKNLFSRSMVSGFAETDAVVMGCVTTGKYAHRVIE